MKVIKRYDPKRDEDQIDIVLAPRHVEALAEGQALEYVTYGADGRPARNPLWIRVRVEAPMRIDPDKWEAFRWWEADTDDQVAT